MPLFEHGYAFDPSCGMSLDELLALRAPEPPADFAPWWRARCQRALAFDPCPVLGPSPLRHEDWWVSQLRYYSTSEVIIGGWLLTPRREPVERAVVVGHGYGGRQTPDFDLPFSRTAILFPCFRGLSRSALPGVPQEPRLHVVHGIEDRERYLIGGCVEDLWLAASSLLWIYPGTRGRLGYLGRGLGGGVGALALAWDRRFARALLHLPELGNHPLCLSLPGAGLLDALGGGERERAQAMITLRYHDAATAASFVEAPAHVAAALFDPVVPPPGQFSIHNALAGERGLTVLPAGHFEYPGQGLHQRRLSATTREFFASL